MNETNAKEKRRGLLHLLRSWLPLSLLFGGASCASTTLAPPPEVVPYVDLQRYTGTWYEIARFPNRFQKDCFGSTATYSLQPDGKIAVVNRCRKNGPDGPLSSVSGTARVVDPRTNAKLKVTFFWPFSGDYWIVDLGEQYDYAVVSGPDRKYLWVLGRTPSMEPERYRAVVTSLRNRGFDVSRLVESTSEGRR